MREQAADKSEAASAGPAPLAPAADVDRSRRLVAESLFGPASASLRFLLVDRTTCGNAACEHTLPLVAF